MIQVLLYSALLFLTGYVPVDFTVLANTCNNWTAPFVVNVHIQLVRALSFVLFGLLWVTSIVSACLTSRAPPNGGTLLMHAFPAMLLLFFGLPVWFTVPYSVMPDAASLAAALGSKASLLPGASCNGNFSFPAIVNQNNLPACVLDCDVQDGVSFCCVPYDLIDSSKHLPQTLMFSTYYGFTVLTCSTLLLVWSLMKTAFTLGQISYTEPETIVPTAPAFTQPLLLPNDKSSA